MRGLRPDAVPRRRPGSSSTVDLDPGLRRGTVSQQAVDRFRADLEALADPPTDRIGLAVSGGPDSLALLLLATSAFPGRVRAATVDHGFRPEAADEARFVADIAARLGVPHDILTLEWPDRPPRTALQERAREGRYAALQAWCATRGLAALLTAHHADDQAETLLMRLNRGAGLPGLAGIRPVQRLGELRLLRPLLQWRSTELAAICAEAGLAPVDDPSNRDPHHERTRVRQLLSASAGLDAAAVAASADHLFDVEQAMQWIVEEVLRTRVELTPDGALFDHAGLPFEIKRRLLAALLSRIGATPRGSEVARIVDQLENGRPATLGAARIRPGERWTIAAAPPRLAK